MERIITMPLSHATEDLLTVGGRVTNDGKIEFPAPNRIVRLSPGSATQRGESINRGHARQGNLEYLAYIGAGKWTFAGHSSARDTAEEVIEVLESMIADLQDRPAEEMTSHEVFPTVYGGLEHLTYSHLKRVEARLAEVLDRREKAIQKKAEVGLSDYQKLRAENLEADKEAQWERLSRAQLAREADEAARREQAERARAYSRRKTSAWCKRCQGPVSSGGTICDSCLAE